MNASPDLLAQLQANPFLQPGRAIRDTALCGIVLADGQVDHTTGLYMLREAQRPWPLWCTDSAYADLTRGNPILGVLSHYCGVDRRRIGLDGATFTVDGVEGVRWRALPVASKPAPYSPNRESPVPGDNIALELIDEVSGRSIVYAPGLGEIDDTMWRAMQAARCVMVDGTFWTDDEMIQLGVSRKRARDIGHLPQSGPGGMLEWLGRLGPETRKVLIHINNTNPILDEDSPERGELCAPGRRGGVRWPGDRSLIPDTQEPWSREEFEARLQDQGSRYHIYHPFNVMLNTGGASREQIRGWVANRFYYQISIPIKDAAILSNCPDRAVRRSWVQRILDHDGYGDDPGGIDSWLRLAEAVGLTRERTESLVDVLPGVRFAVDAYVNFARRAPWQEAVCSSLTELFAPQIHKQRLANWPEHYPWIDLAGLHYFQSRVSLARRDVEFGLAFTLDHFRTREQQERAIEILRFKLDVLWQMNDAMALHYGVKP